MNEEKEYNVITLENGIEYTEIDRITMLFYLILMILVTFVLEGSLMIIIKNI